MCKVIVFAAFLFVLPRILAQTVTNGNFDSGSTGWGCNPEINSENVYGGSTGNAVAEVDFAAGLCQTITGFTAGLNYTLTFSASRRTNCGPVLQSMNVLIGAAAITVSRNGTPYGYTAETVVFTATAASQTLSFVSLGTETCNLIVDNIIITPVSNLPVELKYFTAEAGSDQAVDLNWTTASENRNDYFTVERSQSGFDWEVLSNMAGTGTEPSVEDVDYALTDKAPYRGVSYYRLSQTDLDGTTKYLAIRSVDNDIELFLYPNPARDQVTVRGNISELRVFDHFGQDLTGQLEVASGQSELLVDLSGLGPGIYFVRTDKGNSRLVKL